jgi:hypothetical protein
VTHPEHDGLVGEARGDCNRRDCSMPSPEKTTWHGRLKMPQLNSLHTVTKTRTVITVVVTAWPREVSIAGGNGVRRNQGFGYGDKLGQRGRTSGLGFRRGIYTELEGASSRRRGRRGCQREEKPTTTSRWPPCARRDEDDASPLLFWRKGIVGWRWAVLVGYCWAVVVCCGGQVRSGKPLSISLFHFFLFCIFSIFCFIYFSYCIFSILTHI